MPILMDIVIFDWLFRGAVVAHLVLFVGLGAIHQLLIIYMLEKCYIFPRCLLRHSNFKIASFIIHQDS